MRILPALLVLVCPWPAQADNYSAGPGGGGFIKVEVRETGLLKGKTHVFTFDSWRGQIEYSSPNAAATAVRLSVDAARFTLDDDWVSVSDRDKIVAFTHSKGMLDTTRHPTITIEGTGLEPARDGEWRMTARLSIRGVTRPVLLQLRIEGLRATGNTTFRLTDFGLKPPSALLGAIGTMDEILIRFEVTAR